MVTIASPSATHTSDTEFFESLPAPPKAEPDEQPAAEAIAVPSFEPTAPQVFSRRETLLGGPAWGSDESPQSEQPASSKSDVTATSVAPPKPETEDSSIDQSADAKAALASTSVVPSSVAKESPSTAPQASASDSSIEPPKEEAETDSGEPTSNVADAVSSDVAPVVSQATKPSSSKSYCEPVTSPALPSNVRGKSAPSIPVAGTATAKAQSARPSAVSDAQTSMSPLVADEELPRAKRKPQLWLLVAAAAVVVGGIWGAKGGQLATKAKRVPAAIAMNQPQAENAEAPTPREEAPVPAAPAATPSASNSESPLAAPPPTNDPGRPAALADGAPSASAPDEAAKEPGYTRVKVEIFPVDSTVAIRGKGVNGPLVFDVIKGTKTILEVAHPGYVTRRIILDGKKPFVRVAMKSLPTNGIPVTP